MITSKTEAKTTLKYISCDCKCKFNSTTCYSDKKWNNEACQCECKSYCTCKKDYNWNPSTCIFENGKYLKSIVDNSRIVCDEIIYVMDIVSTKMTNTIATNVPTNSDGEIVRYKMDCYILRIVLLVIILSLIITIICYHHAKLKNMKMESNEF